MSDFNKYEHIENFILKYYKTDWESLLREDLGKHHLKELEPHLGSIRYVMEQIIAVFREIGHEKQFENYQQIFINLFTKFLTITNTINKYPPPHNIDGENYTIVITVMNFRASVWRNYLLISKDLASSDISKQKLKACNLDTTKATEELSEAKEAISQHAKFSAERAVTLSGKSFEKEAKKNETASQLYGIALFLFAFLACGIAVVFFNFNDNIEVKNIPELLIKGNILNKIFIFTILLLLVSVLKTNHLSLKHQYSLNKHRQNALNSHKTILNAIQKTKDESDSKIANAILLELTKAMFAPQETGFIKNQKDSSSGNQIVDISRSAFKNHDN